MMKILFVLLLALGGCGDRVSEYTLRKVKRFCIGKGGVRSIDTAFGVVNGKTTIIVNCENKEYGYF